MDSTRADVTSGRVTPDGMRPMSPTDDTRPRGMTGSEREVRDVDEQPGGGLQGLDRLEGTWEVSGDASGEVTYRWMPGRRVLLQEGHLDYSGHRNDFIEVIRRDRGEDGEPTPDITSTVFTADGQVLHYTHEVEGDAVTIWYGERGSDDLYRGRLSPDGRTLTGAWSWPGGGCATTATRM
jgi:hypothetical protein